MRYLEMERLLLRAVMEADVHALFDIYGDPATNLYNPNGPYPSLQYAEDRLAAWLKGWREEGCGQWAVAKREAPERIIGFGGLSYMDYGGETRLNLGYRFAASAWGMGYASETARAALRCAFDQLGAPAVYGKVRPANHASIRVLEKQGFRQAGELADVPDQPASRVYLLTRAGYAVRD
ncbi:GNAT family N-acetyltransferase [Chromobacterium alticapitis]|uniref:GNAT family N-acetyltransferase n=1 Tax=Chromobacterium alticapitis TaxID=2073169 RepID=A0A2S5DHW4_9NEIS|nr:GNAT family N-acetyltransferase [Chromobacterium alticapitis]POZ62588.1 GNAT family N-acetyltransferase [Chromobacterium alticapitis]